MGASKGSSSGSLLPLDAAPSFLCDDDVQKAGDGILSSPEKKFCDARACALDCARQRLQCKNGDPSDGACESRNDVDIFFFCKSTGRGWHGTAELRVNCVLNDPRRPEESARGCSHAHGYRGTARYGACKCQPTDARPLSRRTFMCERTRGGKKK